MRVLVVDDDEAIRSVLQRGLRTEGFDVDVCADGKSGLWRAIDGGYAAIVLDLLLPGQSGYRVCEQIRAEGIDTPILVLTAKSGELDQIDVLDGGADDFPTKPVSLAVLVARLNALIRRRSSVTQNLVVRGVLEYDFGSRACSVVDKAVRLTLREDQVLRQLLLAGRACVTRQELVDSVWGPAADVDPSIIDIYIRRVRTKLAPVLVENVRGVGYRVVSD